MTATTSAPSRTRSRSIFSQRHRTNTLLIVVLTVISLIVIFPVLYAVFTSFRPKGFGLSRDWLAVSYTHLDVYKRQLLRGQQCAGRHDLLQSVGIP